MKNTAVNRRLQQREAQARKAGVALSILPPIRRARALAVLHLVPAIEAHAQGASRGGPPGPAAVPLSTLLEGIGPTGTPGEIREWTLARVERALEDLASAGFLGVYGRDGNLFITLTMPVPGGEPDEEADSSGSAR